MREFHGDDTIWNYAFHNAEFFDNYGVTIAHTGQGETISIKGLLMDTLALSFENEYEASKGASLAKGLASMAIERGVGRSGSEMAGVMGQKMGVFTGKTVGESVQYYAGGSMLGVGFSILVCKEFTPNYERVILDSLRMTNPTFGLGAAGNVEAPNKYSPHEAALGKDSVTDTESYQILVGRHLHIKKMLPKSFNYAHSAQKREDGEPMYLKLQYSFMAGRLLEYAEVAEWFKTLK